MSEFSDKIVVITGAAQGLGKSFAENFVKAEAEAVVMMDLNEEVLQNAAKDIDPQGGKTFAVTCNVADRESVKAAFAQVHEKYGRVDILINNAGITRDALVHKMTAEQFDAVLKVSLYGAFYCVQQVVDGMRERQYGRIISMSSLANRGNVGQCNYAAAKAGIVGLTKTLAMELGRKGITANCVAPCVVNTDIIKTVPEKVLQGMVQQIPVQRVGEPEEVASVVMYLASDKAAYVSGQCINVTGGWW